MTGLLSQKQKDAASSEPIPSSLVIEGIPYTNTAAKFWPSLIDEVHEDFPDCSDIELSAATSEGLDLRRLFPTLAFEKEFKNLETANIEDVMKEAIAELAILGPPASVQVRLLSDKRELLCRAMPADCLDAGIFSYLLAWLLQWARIPASTWNNEFLNGNVTVEDRQRRRTYNLSFDLVRKHLSEGLHQRTITLAAACRR